MDSRQLTTNSSYHEIFQRLAKLTTSVICDATHEVRLMDTEISPVVKGKQCIGRAYTVNSAQDSLSTMQALDDLQAYLAFLDPASAEVVPIILTIASCGSPYALAGGMCATSAKLKGFAAVLIDGPCRDIDEIKECGLPFFAKGKCAKSGTKDKVGARREVIECGGVVVNPGDIIFGDTDGIVVMNKQEAVDAIAKGEMIKDKEAQALRKFQEGASFNDITNLDEHVKCLQLGIASTFRMTI